MQNSVASVEPLRPASEPYLEKRNAIASDSVANEEIALQKQPRRYAIE
jgi:hypothetical protein